MPHPLIHKMLALRAKGWSKADMAVELGLTRGSVAGALWRHDHGASVKRDPDTPPRRRGGSRPRDWDEKLFEPYAKRKERLARQRRRNHVEQNQ